MTRVLGWVVMTIGVARAYEYGQNVTCPGDLVYTDCGTLCEPICGEEAPTFCAFVCVAGCQCPSGSWREDATSEHCHSDASG